MHGRVYYSKKDATACNSYDTHETYISQFLQLNACIFQKLDAAPAGRII